MKKIKKAVIPAAGLGTRFLPATKSIPKEMLPIVDQPSILYCVEEAISAGIEDIVIIAGRGKNAIEDFFDRSYELEDTLVKSGKTDLLEKITRVRNLANIISIRQKVALGLGHAVLCAEPIVGNEPFAVLLGDEIMIGEPSVTQQLCHWFEESNFSSTAIMEVPKQDVTKYGIVAIESYQPTVHKITDIVEKPSIDKAPSQWALPGRYAFKASIFNEIKNIGPGKNGEIQLTDAMCALARQDGLLGVTFKNRRYDTGDKLGYLQANIEMALEHPDLKDAFKKYLSELSRRI